MPAVPPPESLQTEQERAAAMAADDRTIPQLSLDALVDIVRLATRAESSDLATVFGVRSPAVRVHVQAADLQHGNGFAYFEGQTAFVSTTTAQRLACDTGWLPVLFDGAKPIEMYCRATPSDIIQLDFN